MSPRQRSRDETEESRLHRAPADQYAGTMFDSPPPSWTQRWASLTDAERKAQRERWQEKLLPIVLEFVVTREDIIASDVISRGITDGVLNGERAFLAQHPKVYSFVGPWLGALAVAGVIGRKTVALPDGGELQLTRKSERDPSHGNKNLRFTRAA